MLIFKAGDRSNLNNYRPISILPVLCEIFEGIIHKKFLSYLDYFEFLDSLQFGFRPYSSTYRAGSNNLQFIYNNLDDASVLISIFLDSAKAFDSVYHISCLKN